MDQTHSIFEDPMVLGRAHEIKKVIVSNQGSVLDNETFPTTALLHFVMKCNKHLPNMAVLTLESRPEYVDDVELEVLSRALEEGATPTTLEIAIGLEVFDDDIRNLIFGKGLRKQKLDALAERLAEHGFRMKCYFMFKPVLDEHMSRADAINDVQGAIRYLSDVMARVPNSMISIHLNPTYAARGTPLEAALKAGKYTPPHLSDVVRAIRFGEGRGIPIFVGMNEENLAVKGGSFVRPGDEETIRIINEFNKTQDYGLFKQLPD
jgi:radical SAM enzyme (TIGR01210 family)